MQDWAAYALLAATGLAAGVASTLLGVGGGLVMVPVLHYGLGMPWHHATALSLLAIALQTPGGVLQHARRGAVDWRLGALLAAGGLAGTALAWWLEPHVPVGALKLLFAALMLLAAWRLVAGRMEPKAQGHHPALVVAVGAAAGVASKWLGIGGGLVTVPALVLLGSATHLAVGSSLVPVFTNATAASGFNLASGGIPLAWAAILGAAALAGNPLGARLAHALPDAGLRKVAAAALVPAALAVAWTA